MVEDDDIIQC